MQLLTGTSGFSYKEWKGTFYPDDLKDKEMLAYYAQQLPSVEINNTFYRMPKKDVLANWRDQVTSDFRFVIKASRRITHIKRLKDAHDELDFLCRNVETLLENLGCLLFQTPGNLKKDLDRLQAFIDQIPLGTKCAFEFRHASWFDDEVYDCLRAANAALCFVDADDQDTPPAVVATADFGYFRLRNQNYSDHQLAEWIGRVQQPEWKEAFVFFKHEDAGAGPALAQQFQRQFDAGTPKE